VGALVTIILLKMLLAAFGLAFIFAAIASIKKGNFVSDNDAGELRREKNPIGFWIGVISAFLFAGWVFYLAITARIDG